MASISESATTSNLLRSRPAILIVASFAAACSIYLHYSLRHPASGGEHASQGPNPLNPELHRSNAVRRRRRSRAEDSLHEGDDNPIISIEADDGETEKSPADEDEVEAQKSVLLDELVWAITKNRAKTDGRIHRSITCDMCGNCPIIGIRYRCANCPDFDLCESCESRDVHHPTHVFYKIKVPAPWAGKVPSPVWYPGKPHMLPEELPLSIKKRLSQLTGQGRATPQLSEDRIGGLYAQFRNIANKRWDLDPYELFWAMNKQAFRDCIVPQITPRDKNNLNLIYDRIFVFYDNNDDDLIGLEEFVLGTFYIHSKGEEEWKRRLFKGFDLDDDCYIARSDMLLVFRAYYELTGDNITNHLFARRTGEDPDQVREGPDMLDFIRGGRPLASYFPRFPSQLPQFPQNMYAGEHKAIDENGDLVPTDGEGSSILDTINDESRLLGENLIITDAWISPTEELDAESLRLVNGLPLKYPKIADVMCVMKERLYGKELFLSKDQVWVIWRVVPSENGIKPPLTVALYVPPNTVPKALMDHVRRQKAAEVVEDKLSIISGKAVQYAGEYLQKLKKKSESQAMETHRKRLRWLSSETTKPIIKASKYPSNVLDSSNGCNVSPNKAASPTGGSKTLAQSNEDHSRSDQGMDSDTVLQNRRSTILPAYGNAATQTMFDVLQKALNDMLDPIFAAAEDQAVRAEELEDKIEEYEYFIKWYDHSKEITWAHKKDAWNELLPEEATAERFSVHLDFIANANIVVTLAALNQNIKADFMLENDPGFHRMIEIIEEHDTVKLSEEQRHGLFEAFERHVAAVFPAMEQQSMILSTIKEHSESSTLGNGHLENGKPPIEALYSDDAEAKSTSQAPEYTVVIDMGQSDGQGSTSLAVPPFSLAASFINLVWCQPPAGLPPPENTPDFFDLAPLSLGELSLFKRVNEQSKERGGGGRLNLKEFKEKLSNTHGDGERRWPDRTWIGSWLEVVTF